MTISDRVSRAVGVIEDADKFNGMSDSAGEEKTAKSCKISLGRAFVVQIFVFFPFLSSSGSCDVATRVGEPISAC